MAQIGYIRAGEGEAAAGQLDGVTLDVRFAEKQDGRDPVRPVLRECLGVLRRGDTLHVHSFDRLARNVRELQALIDSLTAAGVAVQFHREKLTFQSRDASAAQQLLFRILTVFAEFERTVAYAERNPQPVAVRAKSKRQGRPPKLDPRARQIIAQRLAAGEDSSSLAAEFKVSLTSILKIRHESSSAEQGERA